MKNLSTSVSENLNKSNKTFAELYEELKNLAVSKSSANHIVGNYHKGLCPYLQFIRFDALDPKDYPHHIDDNSIFLEFEIDFSTNKVEFHRGGHIYLSPADKKTDKYRYLAMRSMVSVAVDDGVKKFRKQGFKSVEDLFNKMETYYKNVMKSVENYTGGYPYKDGK